MINIILILFLIGHVLGEFYFQTDKLAIDKDKSITKLLLHCLIYLIAMILTILPVFSINLLKSVLVISITHLIIDFAKFLIKKKININDKLDLILYFIDQTLHFIAIFIVVGIMYYKSEHITYIKFFQYLLNNITLSSEQIFSWILNILIIINPISITIKKVLYPYRAKEEEVSGYPNAGALIGKLERCIILLFLSIGQYSAIGFVLTAKSIARYNKIVDEPKFSEYYLLGTLLSVLLVIVSYLFISIIK